MNIADMLPENSLEEGSKHFQRLILEGTSQNEMLYRTKNGAIKWWSVTAVKISENHFLGFCNDISDRKRAKNILHSERQRFELILEQSLAGYWDWLLQENTEYLTLLCQIIRPPLVAYMLSLWRLFFVDVSLPFAGEPLRG